MSSTPPLDLVCGQVTGLEPERAGKGRGPGTVTIAGRTFQVPDLLKARKGDNCYALLDPTSSVAKVFVVFFRGVMPLWARDLWRNSSNDARFKQHFLGNALLFGGLSLMGLSYDMSIHDQRISWMGVTALIAIPAIYATIAFRVYTAKIRLTDALEDITRLQRRP